MAIPRGRSGLLRQESGATAIEFAMVAPLMLLTIFEIMQGGIYVYVSAALDVATTKAARQIAVGNLGSSAATADGFRSSVLCPNLLPGMACANIVSSLQTAKEGYYGGGYATFVKPDQTGLIEVAKDNAQTPYCSGAPRAYQYLQVFYAMPVFSPVWRAALSTNWNGSQVAFVRAAAAFRNEPFTTASVSTGC